MRFLLDVNLRKLKRERGVRFFEDDLSAEHLPQWVRTSTQTTDGHLVMLAA